MRLGIIHYSFWPTVGGVETIMLEHARLFAEAGHELTVFCQPATGSAGIGASPLPCHVEHLPQLIDRSVPSESATFRRRLEALRLLLATRLRGLDLVIIHNVCTMPFDLPLTAALWEAAEAQPATRFIAWVHDLAAANPDYQIPAATEVPWDLLRRAHPRMEYVAVSELRRRQILETLDLPKARCAVIPNGFDAPRHLRLAPGVRDLAGAFGLFEREAILFHPTRLLRRKNVELSLQVAAALRGADFDAVLLITGAVDPHQAASTEYAESLRRLHRQLDLGKNALFLHDHIAVSEEEMDSLYALSDALFFPSRQEGFGLPMLEAACHRLPAFCAGIEPLRMLPGAIPFPPSAAPAEIAGLVMRHLKASPPIQARKAALRAFGWPAIWRNYLAPLLTPPKNTSHS